MYIYIYRERERVCTSTSVSILKKNGDKMTEEGKEREREPESWRVREIWEKERGSKGVGNERGRERGGRRERCF